MRRETLFRVIFWLAVVVALAMALNPQPPHIPGPRSDKLQHFALFFGLTGLALAAYSRARLIPLALALTGFGALIEFLQMIPALHRSAELLDWVADTAGVVLVVALAALRRRSALR